MANGSPRRVMRDVGIVMFCYTAILIHTANNIGWNLVSRRRHD